MLIDACEYHFQNPYCPFGRPLSETAGINLDVKSRCCGIYENVCTAAGNGMKAATRSPVTGRQVVATEDSSWMLRVVRALTIA